jgi:hypothetical protein
MPAAKLLSKDIIKFIFGNFETYCLRSAISHFSKIEKRLKLVVPNVQVSFLIPNNFQWELCRRLGFENETRLDTNKAGSKVSGIVPRFPEVFRKLYFFALSPTKNKFFLAPATNHIASSILFAFTFLSFVLILPFYFIIFLCFLSSFSLTSPPPFIPSIFIYFSLITPIDL